MACYTTLRDRISGKLSARGVATAKPGRHSDGGGLYLVVSPNGTKKWVYRFTFSGRVNETGVGGGDVPLAEAREKAAGLRKQVRDGFNPVAVKRQAKAEMLARVTFGQLADNFISDRAPSWRNPKSEGQWRTSLKTYAAGIANLPVEEIRTENVLAVLKPIWTSKPETAKRVRNRIELILNAAISRGLRAGPNPALWRGHLDHLLPKPLQVERSHHAAMPYDEVPAFLTALRQRETVATLGLELMILTASRTGEVLGARWDEILIKDQLWIIPAARMKSGRMHRKPLGIRALEIITKMAAIQTTSDFVFPGQRLNKPLSHVAFQKVLARMQVPYAAHGFRSSFRDWAGDCTPFPREVCEAALAHSVGDAAEQSYRRLDALQKRRALMETWADWCDQKQTDNVIAFGRPGH